MGLVPADVEVRAREDLGHARQHLLHQIEGRGQFGVQPHGVVLAAGQQLELDLVAAGVQLRVQPHERGRVPGRVDLGHDGDEAVRGVGGQREEVVAAVRDRRARPDHELAPAGGVEPRRSRYNRVPHRFRSAQGLHVIAYRATLAIPGELVATPGVLAAAPDPGVRSG